ncbi:hypothetical protein BDV10DRAFT_159880 [Aspergillus recurvatus]
MRGICCLALVVGDHDAFVLLHVFRSIVSRLWLSSVRGWVDCRMRAHDLNRGRVYLHCRPSRYSLRVKQFKSSRGRI